MAAPQPFERLRSGEFLFGSFVVGIIGLIGALILFHGGKPEEKSMALLGDYVATALWLTFLVHRHGIQWTVLLGTDQRGREWLLVGLVVPLFAMSLACIYLVFLPLSLVNPDFLGSIMKYVAETPDSGSWWHKLSKIFTEDLLAPAVEEVAFRGFLLHLWARRLGIRRALFWTSFLFGILHFDALGGFLFGGLLGLVYLRTRSLLIPITIHSLNNGLASILGGVDTGNAVIDPLEIQKTWYVGAIALAIAVAGLWYAARWYWPKSEWRLPYDAATYD